MGFKGNIVCLVVDRLHAAYLGAYGNTWIQTPALDRLASESFLFDRATIDSPRLDSLYRSYWRGVHAAVPDHSSIATASSAAGFLPARFAAAGWQTALITDEPAIVELPGADTFAESTVIRPDRAPADASQSVVAGDLEATDAAPFFAAASEWLKKIKSPSLLWLHTGTLGRAWDAPLEFRAQYGDEEDPEPGEWASVPNELLPAGVDPDKLLAITHAYAGQVSLVDQFVGLLLDQINRSGRRHDTLFALISARGFPLGEHHRVGPCDDALYAELTHVAWMMSFPNSLGRAARTQRLIQPPDLPATLLDFAGLLHEPKNAEHVGRGRSLLPLVSGEEIEQFDRAYAVAPDQKAFATPVWSMRHSSLASNSLPSEPSKHEPFAGRNELFVKPDDWFDINEVSNRCPDVVEAMLAAMDQFDQACKSANPSAAEPLPPELVE